MPTPYDALVAEAVKDDLNAQTWTIGFQAVRKPVPTWKHDQGELADLRCAVTALGIDNAQEARRLWQFDFRVVVDFQKETDATNQDSVDALGYLVQEVHDRYRASAPALTVAGLQALEVIDAQRPLTYDLERLDEQGIFESYVILTVQGHR